MYGHGRDQYDALLQLAGGRDGRHGVLRGHPLALVCGAGAVCVLSLSFRECLDLCDDRVVARALQRHGGTRVRVASFTEKIDVD